ncbi:MAG: 2-amino-4-hydroxy-6-hydroxymethyldihydropteridine diphosphokinase [Gammaproteobacteria bacterium]|nr:2-amino-4-hydroxy-6-hydroxymethyldihydropteridine diphosphokinase [Gammaproteobacteria bacterium]
MSFIAYIALGSNLNNPILQIQQAFTNLSEHPDIDIVKTSSLYRSEALTLNQEPQPDYINAVAKITTSLSAENLLLALNKIENKHGRERLQKWDARTLDLDILLYENIQISTEVLTIPHPEISKRNFVLIPLAEIAENLQIPIFGQLKNLLKTISYKGINKI